MIDQEETLDEKLFKSNPSTMMTLYHTVLFCSFSHHFSKF